MAFIFDAWRGFHDPLAHLVLSEGAMTKHTRCMDVRARFKSLPLTDAERKVVEIVDLRSELLNVPLWIVAYGPVYVWLYNQFVREVQNPFLRMIATLPYLDLVIYAVPAHLAWCHARAHILDKFFTRDSGIVQLLKKYQQEKSGANDV